MNRNLREIEDWVDLARAAKYQLGPMAERCHSSLREVERHFEECRCLPPEAWIPGTVMSRIPHHWTMNTARWN